MSHLKHRISYLLLIYNYISVYTEKKVKFDLFNIKMNFTIKLLIYTKTQYYFSYFFNFLKKKKSKIKLEKILIGEEKFHNFGIYIKKSLSQEKMNFYGNKIIKKKSTLFNKLKNILLADSSETSNFEYQLNNHKIEKENFMFKSEEVKHTNRVEENNFSKRPNKKMLDFDVENYYTKEIDSKIKINTNKKLNEIIKKSILETFDLKKKIDKQEKNYSYDTIDFYKSKKNEFSNKIKFEKENTNIKEVELEIISKLNEIFAELDKYYQI
nr:hypothetical protein 1634Bnrm2_p052 [Cryptomonas sp.]